MQMLCFFVSVLLLQYIIVLHACFASVAFFSCVVTVYFGLTISKLVLCIFSCSKMCILHPFWICIVQDCLFVYPVAFLRFGMVCIFPDLTYFLQWFYVLFVCFFCTNNSCLYPFYFLQFLVRGASSFGGNSFR